MIKSLLSSFLLCTVIFQLQVFGQLSKSWHVSSYDLFEDLEYGNIDYLQEKEWHGFWHKNWKGYDFNHNNFNDRRTLPAQCDASKDELDCSKISPSTKIVEINGAPIVNVSANSFPVSNSITVLRLISLSKLDFIDDGVFSRLIKLEKLVIVGTDIKKVPQFDREMASLELVDMYNNKVALVPDEAFKNCPKLKWVNLGQNVISYVSQSAFAGTELELLTLHHNELKQVPAIDGVEDTILYLGLEHNSISSVGNYSLQPMKSLSHVNISYNPIHHFEHDCLSSLPNLRFLEILGIGMPTLKLEIPFHFLSGAKKIEHVTLDYSKNLVFSGRAIEIVPSLLGFSARGCGIKGLDFRSFQTASSLTKLWLDWNELSSFQHSMFIHGSFPKLQRLYLNNNQIRDIEWFGDQEFIDRTLIVKRSMKFFNDTSFKLMPDLTILCLKNNNIKQIRNNTFTGLSNLRELYLSNNLLDDESIDGDAYKGLEALRILMVDGNHLKSVPNAVYSLKRLVELNMRRNKLTFISANDFTMLENLQSLDLAANRIILIENKAFPSTITELFLSQNEFNFIDEEIFHDLTNLQHLRLSYNRISYLPRDIFSKNIALESIYLDNNFLKFLNSSHFSNNKLSGNIVLNNNQIAFIGEGSLSSVKVAENILLNDNELYDLPNDGMFQNMVVMGKITVSNNRLTHIKTNTFSNITCRYFKINDNDITEIESNAFNKIRVRQISDLDDPKSFDVSNNPIRVLHPKAFNDISVGNQAVFTNVKPLKVIPSLAFNKLSAKSMDFTDNELDMIETKGFNEVEISKGLKLENVGLKWVDRLAIVGSVSKLSFQHNQIERIPDHALYYVTDNSELDLRNNSIEVIESNALPNCDGDIFLQNNSISLLTENMFGNNDKTKSLSLKSNMIHRLETNIFTGMVRLESLDLRENRLDELPNDLFSSLSALKTLNVKDNVIRYFGGQHELARLQEINMENNLLSGIDPKIVEPGSSLQNFKLKSNKLSCGCGLFNAVTPIKESIQDAVCETPLHLIDVKLNWKDKGHGRYFTKIPADSFVCEPVDVRVEKVDEDSFKLMWNPPNNIRYRETDKTDYCFYDNCPTTQISYGVYCENNEGGVSLDRAEFTSNSYAVPHDEKLPYYCRVTLNYHSDSGVVSSSWSKVVSYKKEVPEPDDLVCEDGDRCYQLSAEYFKMSRDVGVFNNYGPDKMVNSPTYRRNLMLNYLFKEDAQRRDDVFVPWYGPTNSQNVHTKKNLILPTKVSGGYKVSAERFYPISDSFNQSPRDCDYNVRPLGFTGKLYSSLVRTHFEVLTLGSVDEAWVYLGGQLLVELIAPRDNSEDVCAEIRMLEEDVRVWTGIMTTGFCQVSLALFFLKFY